MSELYTMVRFRPPKSVERGRSNALGRERDQPARMEITAEQLDEAQAVDVRRDPDVLLAPGFRTKLIEPLYSGRGNVDGSWGLDAVGAGTTLTGEGIVVAVLDTGIDASHPAFAGVDIRQQDFSGDGVGDRNGHGTHCAGTIFGREVNGRRIGVAPGIRRALVGKVLSDIGGGDSNMIFAGLDWALKEGAHVISMSVGFDFGGEVKDKVERGLPVELATSEALDAFKDNFGLLAAIISRIDRNEAFGTSPLVVGASGNESRRDKDPSWRISASVPSSALHLSVAALGFREGRFPVAYFSNGKAKIAAPGVDVVSAAPGGGYAAKSGTSMACPHVVGVAALWGEAFRKKGQSVTAELLKSHLLSRARLDDVDGDPVDVGVGLVQAPNGS